MNNYKPTLLYVHLFIWKSYLMSYSISHRRNSIGHIYLGELTPVLLILHISGCTASPSSAELSNGRRINNGKQLRIQELTDGGRGAIFFKEFILITAGEARPLYAPPENVEI